jgi:outer membrane protein OmpA-like peptidoglycan-associated protein
MKTRKLFLPVLYVALFILLSCKNGNKQNMPAGESRSDTAQTASTPDKTGSATAATFNTDNIPVSTAVLGEFPFFSLPQGLQPQNKPVVKSFDQLFFPIDGIMTPVEGKVWKSDIVMKDDNKETWSVAYFLKSYDDAIKNTGGVKIFDAKVSQTELDRIKDQATYFGEEGSLDYWNDPVKVYIIRRENKDDIYIQLSANSARGALQILQKAPFKQTITLLKSAEITKELTEKGKAVLHINFDTDKATLKPDGNEAVAEIVKVLRADNNLKLAINGYTDNSGNDDQNLQLSIERADAVKNELIKAGIDRQRITSAGFGSKNPIAENTSDDGKARNRRVELVKM